MTKLITDKNIPELEILSFSNKEIVSKYADLIKNSGIKKFAPEIEIWTSEASNKALSYYSHGIFRYFGKFPPPIARYLIKTYTKENEPCWSTLEPIWQAQISIFQSLGNVNVWSREQPFGVL